MVLDSTLRQISRKFCLSSLMPCRRRLTQEDCYKMPLIFPTTCNVCIYEGSRYGPTQTSHDWKYSSEVSNCLACPGLSVRSPAFPTAPKSSQIEMQASRNVISKQTLNRFAKFKTEIPFSLIFIIDKNIFYFFKTGSLCVTLVVLELAL